MQMTASPTKRDNVDLNILITGMGTTMDHFPTDFRYESSNAFHRKDDIWEFCREHCKNSDTATTLV